MKHKQAIDTKKYFSSAVELAQDARDNKGNPDLWRDVVPLHNWPERLWIKSVIDTMLLMNI
jgi:hypothetical protein